MDRKVQSITSVKTINQHYWIRNGYSLVLVKIGKAGVLDVLSKNLSIITDERRLSYLKAMSSPHIMKHMNRIS